ncbi:MAG: CPBP family intramembrane metalloprotease [Anaerolineae bacterium]|nr:CPBP family intramembrane metalloprotease [Anaerolineae bacterium]
MALDRVESWVVAAAAGLVALLAEVLLIQSFVLSGITLYSVLLILLLLYGTFRWPHPQHELLVLTIPAVLRLMAYTLPLGNLSPLFAQLVVSVPVGLTVVTYRWLLEQQWPKWPSFRIAWQQFPLYLLLVAAGAAGGWLLYQFQQPALPGPGSPLLWLFYAFVLVAAMAFLEEWLFRGIMQNALTRLWHNRFVAGLVVALIYTTLSLGQGPWPYILLIFVMALALSWLRQTTNNLVGVTVAHAAANLMFFLILPGMSSASLLAHLLALGVFA